MLDTNDARSAGKHCGRSRRHRRVPLSYITVSDLAVRGEMPLSTIYSRIEAGRLNASRWRGLIIIHERDADEFLAVRPLRTAAEHRTTNGKAGDSVPIATSLTG